MSVVVCDRARLLNFGVRFMLWYILERVLENLPAKVAATTAAWTNANCDETDLTRFLLKRTFLRTPRAARPGGDEQKMSNERTAPNETLEAI